MVNYFIVSRPKQGEFGVARFQMAEVRKLRLKWGYPQNIHFNGILRYKPSILGNPSLWNSPYWLQYIYLSPKRSPFLDQALNHSVDFFNPSLNRPSGEIRGAAFGSFFGQGPGHVNAYIVVK